MADKKIQRGESTSRAKSSWRGEIILDEATVTETDASRTFVSLHHHTTFSFLDGFGLPRDHAEAAAQVGLAALANTEHGNVSAHVQHRDACLERGIQPVYGCEVYTGPTSAKQRRRTKNHLTLLASDVTGYRNLLRMVSQSWEDFYQWPTVGPEPLKEYAEGIIALSGCTASLIACSLVGGKHIPREKASYERAKKVAIWMRDVFDGRFFLEVQAFPELEDVQLINIAYERMSQELGIPLVATADIHVPTPDDRDMRAILHNVRSGFRDSLEQQEQEFDYDVPCYLLPTDRDVYRRLRKTGLSKAAAVSAIENTSVIAASCNFEMPQMSLPKFPLNGQAQSSEDLFMSWLRTGWKFRRCNKLTRSEQMRYAERVRKEVRVIREKGYFDYFLIVSDMVRWAKNSGIDVGPGRGSVAASLVAWLLRITEVNPMLYDHMMFERFIDVTREDLPDIDLDFDSDRRHEVRDYLIAKYGEDRVGNIGTFSHYKSKNSLDDVARVYGIPSWEVDKVKELLIERSSGDLRASATIEDTIEYFDRAREVFEENPDLWKATRLEGNIKGMGVHAAGLVVSSEPITDVAAFYTREVKGEALRVISMDKYDAEKMGLLKIDNLGLNTMTLLKHAREYIGMTLDEMYNIPLDDEETIRGFQEGDCVAIFQFDGWAMRLVNSLLRPDSFSEVCDVCALARPGPLHNGAVNEYIAVKIGQQEPKRYHPIVDDITRNTHYQIVYQEQILRIVMEVGGFDWTHAAYIRRIISRKIGEQEFNRQWDRFWTGAKSHGLSEKEAKEIWGACITAGSYAFNIPHSVSYGLLGWWTMWFKRHHPQAFYAAALRALSDEKQLQILQDAVKHGLRVVPPDPNKSREGWDPDGHDGIRAGLTQIKGIGEKMAAHMMAWRDEQSQPLSWASYQAVKGIGPKTVEKIASFAEQEDPFGIYVLTNRIDAVRRAIKDGELELPEPTHVAADIPYQQEDYDTDVVWLGMCFNKNLRDLYEVNLSRTGEPLDPNKTKDPHLNEWVILHCRDDTDQIHVTIDRWKYPKFRKAIWGINEDRDLILVRGVKRGFQTARKIYVKDMWVLDASDADTQGGS